jgi:hypothetical protein
MRSHLIPVAWLRNLLSELSSLALRLAGSNSESPARNPVLCAFTSVRKFQNSRMKYKSIERKVVKHLWRKTSKPAH